MYDLYLDRSKNLPSARKTYQSAGGYCAMAKILYACNIPIPYFAGDVHIPSTEAGDFIIAVAKGLNNYNWSEEVTTLNDLDSGDFQKNHQQAFDLAVDFCRKSGVVNVISSQPNTKELVLA